MPFCRHCHEFVIPYMAGKCRVRKTCKKCNNKIRSFNARKNKNAKRVGF